MLVARDLSDVVYDCDVVVYRLVTRSLGSRLSVLVAEDLERYLATGWCHRLGLNRRFNFT